MRPETKQLIREKAFKFLGDVDKMHDPDGSWIHARDLRSIIQCETDLLNKKIQSLKSEMAIMQNIIETEPPKE